MHNIEEKINTFLEEVCDGKAVLSEEVIEKFGERCKKILRESFVEKRAEDKAYKLSMSKIGKPLRQIMLDMQAKTSGKPNKEFKLRATVGHIYEAFMLSLLEASGAGLEEQDKQVILNIANTEIPGTLDIIVNDKVYDIKTASQFAYDYKFNELENLRNGDSFGYFAQGFGYAMAEGKDFGGWLVINKNTGNFKVLEIPPVMHDELKKQYYNDIRYKVEYINSGLPMPKCKGVVEEYFRKKPTGNKVLNKECEWCDHKLTCHPGIQALPEVFSDAKTKKIKYYVGEVNYPSKKTLKGKTKK